MTTNDRTTKTKTHLRVEEVADLFQVSSKTVVRWADDGKLPYTLTLGGHRRFPRDEIEKIVAGQQRPVDLSA